MSPEDVNQIIELLKQIVFRLGELSVPVYQALYRQQVFSATIGLLIEVLALVAVVLLARKVAAWVRGGWKQFEWKEEDRDWGIGITWGVAAVAILIIVACMHGSILKIANPNYYVIQKLFKMLTGSGG